MREIAIDHLAADLEATSGSEDVTPCLLDVREFEEYTAGHVPGAANVPMGQLAGRLGELDRNRPVHVICASGNRSSAMVDVLVAAGFDAVNVRGGTAAWARTGRPLETGTGNGADRSGVAGKGVRR